MKYWQKRIAEEEQRLYDLSLEQYQKELAKAYKAALAEVKAEVLKLYSDIKDEKASLNDLYRYGRLNKLYDTLGNLLLEYGKEEYSELNTSLSDMYLQVCKTIKDLSPLDVPIPNKTQINEAVKLIWSTDKKSYSARIWLNRAELQQRLGKGIVNTIAAGQSKDKLVLAVQKEFDVSFSQSDRLVRTELTRIMNQSAADSYKAAGCEEFEFLATEDERTCDICSKLNGKRFPFSKLEYGVNCPPLHPNDRCTIIPVVKGR